MVIKINILVYAMLNIREVIDITELNKEIAGIVEREAQLRAEIDKIVAEIDLSAERQG